MGGGAKPGKVPSGDGNFAVADVDKDSAASVSESVRRCSGEAGTEADGANPPTVFGVPVSEAEPTVR